MSVSDLESGDVVRAVVVSRTEMMRYHDPVRIQGFCEACEKYGRFWSCPPFEAAPLSTLDEWSHAILVTQRTPVPPGIDQTALIELFQEARMTLAGTMQPWEVDRAVAVVAGHCFGCSSCTRPRGVACAVPARMRYSLEALGFDVTGLAERLAGQAVHWPASGMPDYLLMVGALLCPSLEFARQRVPAI